MNSDTAHGLHADSFLESPLPELEYSLTQPPTTSMSLCFFFSPKLRATGSSSYPQPQIAHFPHNVLTVGMLSQGQKVGEQKLNQVMIFVGFEVRAG